MEKTIKKWGACFSAVNDLHLIAASKSKIQIWPFSLHPVNIYQCKVNQKSTRNWHKMSAKLTLYRPTPQNGQSHSNNSSAIADQLFECAWPFCRLELKGLTIKTPEGRSDASTVNFE